MTTYCYGDNNYTDGKHYGCGDGCGAYSDGYDGNDFIYGSGYGDTRGEGFGKGYGSESGDGYGYGYGSGNGDGNGSERGDYIECHKYEWNDYNEDDEE